MDGNYFRVTIRLSGGFTAIHSVERLGRTTEAFMRSILTGFGVHDDGRTYFYPPGQMTQVVVETIDESQPARFFPSDGDYTRSLYHTL